MSNLLDDRPAAKATDSHVIARLSFVDRFLPVWILLAMGLGLGLGRGIPGLNRTLDSVQVTSGTSLPIFIGLLVMMYPVLAKVRYGEAGAVTRDRRMLVSSLVLNWLVGPAAPSTCSSTSPPASVSSPWPVARPSSKRCSRCPSTSSPSATSRRASPRHPRRDRRAVSRPTTNGSRTSWSPSTPSPPTSSVATVHDGLVFDEVRVRLIEVGEAIKALPAEADLPWAQIAGMRDGLAHRYFDTSHAILAATVEHDLPQLEAAPRRLLQRVEAT